MKTQQLITSSVVSFLLVTTVPLLAHPRPSPTPTPVPTPSPTPTPSESLGTYSSTGSMNVARFGHKTILLGNGQVLAVTGDTTGANTAELYNPATGTWTSTGTPAMFHEDGSATLLANGQVLLAGGDNGFSPPAFTAAAELYNPSAGQWTVTGSMPSARRYQAAVLLPNGQVLVAGGEDSSFASVATATLYNPATGTWQSTGSMNQSRARPLAVLLTNGTVLVAGGDEVASGGGPISPLTSAEIYDPSTGRWTSIANLPGRDGPAVLLENGELGALLQNGDALVVRDAFFDLGAGTWTATGPFPFSTQRIGPSTATLLTTGEVLLTGFRSTYNDTPTISLSALYNFSTNSYAATQSGPDTFADAATLLPNGQVLVSGGYRKGVGFGTVYLSSAELYTR